MVCIAKVGFCAFVDWNLLVFDGRASSYVRPAARDLALETAMDPARQWR
jgi:hypothetical protein